MRAWWLSSAGSFSGFARLLSASRLPPCPPCHHLLKASSGLVPPGCVPVAALVLLFWFTSLVGHFTPLLDAGAFVVFHHSVGAAAAGAAAAPAAEGLRRFLKKSEP